MSRKPVLPYDIRHGKGSQHKYGRTADISNREVTTKSLAAYVDTLMPGTGGIGTYRSFVHVDVRA